MKDLVILAIALATSLGFVPEGSAHTTLSHAVPAAGSTVHAPPSQIKLWFTGRFEPAFSTVQVVDRSGTRVDNGKPLQDPGNAKLLVATVPQLAPGTYRVKWRVLSVDNHVSEGEFAFDISP